MADLLSRWTGSHKDVTELYVHVQDLIWIPVDLKLLDIDPELSCVSSGPLSWGHVCCQVTCQEISTCI